MLDSLRRFKADVFQGMAHPTRVGIVEQLRLGELSVGQLCERLHIEQSNASQHLAILRNRQIVETRKDGNQIFYRLRDPSFGEILELLRRFYVSQMQEAIAVFRDEEHAEARSKPRRKKIRAQS